MSIRKKFVLAVLLAVAALFCAVTASDSVSAAYPAPQLSRDLGLGSTGQDVMELQKFLNGNGYVVASSGSGSSGNETYYFGYATKAALARFQSANRFVPTGYLDSATRAFIATGFGAGNNSNVLTLIESLKAQIAALQAQLNALLSGSGSDPYITAIEVVDDGNDDAISSGDAIKITFSEAIDPESINNSLDNNGYVAGVTSSQTGGVSVSGSGVVTIKNIASFDAGTVEKSGTFTVRLSLNSTGKVLTITLTGANEVGFIYEDFDYAAQVGGTVTDLSGYAMEADSSISIPSGSFGGDDNNNDSGDPYITSIKVYDNGDENYIDEGDAIKITFSEAINPESINDDLDEGDSVSNVLYSETGGVNVSMSGLVTIKDIATFDAGTVGGSSTFAVRLALDSTGKVLTITLTSGSVKITDEDFSNATQVGGTVEDRSGNEMESDSSIDEPTGTFGGDDYGSGNGPYITAIKVYDEGDEDYIDIPDAIKITFSEAIDPKSINSNLTKGGYVTGVGYSSIGGMSVSSNGVVNITGIATFDAGTVEEAEDFVVRLDLSTNGEVLTITITGGNDVEITDESFANTTQVGGAVKDANGNRMESDSDIDEPTGTFGGDNDDSDNPYITYIEVNDGGDDGYIDKGDTIEITFSEPIEPNSINSNLDEGGYVSNVSSSSIGGVSVSGSGVVTVRDIVTFDAGSVVESKSYTVRLDLDSTGKILTITLTGGSDTRLTYENFSNANQLGGTVEDANGNEMEAESNITSPEGNF